MMQHGSSVPASRAAPSSLDPNEFLKAMKQKQHGVAPRAVAVSATLKSNPPAPSRNRSHNPSPAVQGLRVPNRIPAASSIVANRDLSRGQDGIQSGRGGIIRGSPGPIRTPAPAGHILPESTLDAQKRKYPLADRLPELKSVPILVGPPPTLPTTKLQRTLKEGHAQLTTLRKAMSSPYGVTVLGFDIETWEFDIRPAQMCTEVGVAEFWKAPGVPARLAKGNHFVVDEMYDRRSGNRVPDHKCHFNTEFGRSQRIPCAEIPDAVQKILIDAKLKGEVILVVHGGADDRMWLDRWKCILEGIHVLDTQYMAQALKYEWEGSYTNGRKLEYLLAGHKIPYKNLHNGGNDAVYTWRVAEALAAASEGEYSFQVMHYFSVAKHKAAMVVQW